MHPLISHQAWSVESLVQIEDHQQQEQQKSLIRPRAAAHAQSHENCTCD